MDNYCEICNKTYASIQSLSNHKRIFHDDKKDDKRTKNTEDNLYHCRYCEDKSYSSHKSRWKHEQTCKPSKCQEQITPIKHILEENKQLKEENEKIKTECDLYKDKIIELQDKLINQIEILQNLA